MRIMFTCLPVPTHLRPLVVVADEARRRGHDVVVCSARGFEDEVHAHGLDFLAAGTDWLTPLLAPSFDSPRISQADVTVLMQQLLINGYAAQPVEQTATEIARHVTEWRPDVIVREAYDFAGYLAASIHQLPHSSVGVVGRVSEFLDMRTLAPLLNRRRASLGLPAVDVAMDVYRDLHAHFMPQSFDPADLAIPTIRTYRHRTADLDAEPLPAVIADAPTDHPFVLVTLGTVAPLFSAATPTLQILVSALGKIDCTALVAVGSHYPERLKIEHASNVHIRETVPQTTALACADVFITHAGFTSVREAVVAGVPTVAIPWIAENHLVASGVKRTGMGISLYWDTLTEEDVIDAVRLTTTDPKFRREASRLQRAMLALPSIADYLSDLESLVKDRSANPAKLSQPKGVTGGC